MPNSNYELALKRIKQRYENQGLAQHEADAKASQEMSFKEQQDDLNWWEKAVGTLIDFGTDIGKGAIKGLEGLFDAGASLVAQVGDWFGADTSGIQDVIKYDVADNVMNSDFMKAVSGINSAFLTMNFSALPDVITYQDKIESQNYINDMPDFWQNVTHGVGESIGGMLPMMTLGVAGVGQVGTLAEFGTQAMGQSVEQSLNEGHGLSESIGYGVLSGAKEALTELVNAELFGQAIGGVVKASKGATKAGEILTKEASKTITKTGLKSFFGELLKNGFFEGLEEVEGDVLDPLIRKITIERDGDLGDMYVDSLKGMPESFVSGALSGMLMSGLGSTAQVMNTSLSTYKATEQVTDAVGTLEKAIVEIDANENLTEQQKQEQAQPYLDKIQELKDRYNELTGTFVSENVKLNSAKGQSARYMQELSNSLSKINTIDDASFDSVKRTLNDKYGVQVYKDTSEELAKVVEENNLQPIQELSNKNIEGWTDGKGNIYIAEDSKAFKQGNITKYQTIAHEIGHNLSQNQKTKLHSTVLNKTAKTSDKLFNRAVNGKSVEITGKNWRENYAKIYVDEIKGMSESEATSYLTEEFVNDYISQKATNAKELNQLIKADETNFLKRMFSKQANRDKIIENLIEKGLKKNAKNYKASMYDILAVARNIGATQDEITDIRQKAESILASKGNEVKNNGKEDTKNEFRRIQETSRNISSEEQQLYWRGSKTLNERERQVLSNALRRWIESRSNKFGNSNELNLKSEDYNTNFKFYQDVDAHTFYEAFRISRTYLKYGELVDLHDEKEYKNTTNYLSEDGMQGFAITKEGDLISVYNADKSHKGFVGAIRDFIEKNAVTLDCFVSPNQPLNEIYQKKLGFKVASIMEHNMIYDRDNIAKNHNNPKVAFMVKTNQPVEVKNFNKDQYEEAKQWQQKYLKDNIKKSKSNAIDEKLELQYISDKIEIYDAKQKKLVIDFINDIYNKNNSVRMADLYGSGLDVYLTDSMFKEFGGKIENGERVGEINEEDIISWLKRVSNDVIKEDNGGIIYIDDSAIEKLQEQPKVEEKKQSKIDQVKPDKFSKDVIDQINTTDEAISKIGEIVEEVINTPLEKLIELQNYVSADGINEQSRTELANKLLDMSNSMLEVLEARRLLRNKFKADTKFVKAFKNTILDNDFYKEVFKPYTIELSKFAKEVINGNTSRFEDLKKISVLSKSYDMLVKKYQSIPSVDSEKLDNMFNYPLLYSLDEIDKEFKEHKQMIEEKADPVREVKRKFLTRLDNLIDNYPNLNITELKKINDYVNLMKSKINELSYSMDKFDDKTKKIDEAYQTLGSMLDNAQDRFDSQLKKTAKKENTTAVQIVNAKGELTTVNLNENEDESLKKTYAKILGTDNETKKEINETIGIRNEAEKELNNAVDNLNEINDKIDEAKTKTEEQKLKAEKEKAIKQAQIAQKNKISVATKLVRKAIKTFKESYTKCYEYIEKMDNASIKRDIIGNKDTGGNKKGLYNSAKEVLEKLNGSYAIINTETKDIKEAVNYYDFEDDTKKIHDTTYDDLAKDFNDWFLGLGINLPQEIEDARLRNLERIELGKSKRASKKAKDIAEGLLELEAPKDYVEILEGLPETQEEKDKLEEEPKVIVREKTKKPRKPSTTKIVRTIESMRKMVKRDSAKLVDEWTNARKDKVTRLKTVNDAIDVIETTLNNIKGNTFRFLFVNGTNGENGRELVADTIHKIVNGYGAYKNIPESKKVDVITQILVDNAQNMFFNDNADITYQNVNDIPDNFSIKQEIVDCIRETVDTMINEKYEVTDSALRLQKLTKKYRKSLDKMIKQYDELNTEYISLNSEIKTLKQEIKNSKSKVDKEALNNLVDKMVARQLKEYKTKTASVEKVNAMRETIKTLRDNLRSTSKDKNKLLNQNITMYNDLYGEKKVKAFRGQVQSEIKALTGEKYQLRDDLYAEIAVQLGKGNIEEASKLLIDDITTEPVEVNVIDLETGDIVLDDEGNPKKEMVEVRYKEFAGTEEYNTLVQIVNDMFKSIYEGANVSYKARMEQAVKDLRAKVSEITQMNRVIDGIKAQANTIKDMSKNKGKALKGGIAKSVQVIANTFSKIARNSVLNGKFRRVISAFYKNYTYKGVNDIAISVKDNLFTVKNADGIDIANATTLEFDEKGKITKLVIDNGIKATIENDKIILTKDGSTIAVLEGMQTSKHKNADGTKSYSLDGFDVSYTGKGDSVMEILDYPLNSELEDKIKEVINLTGKVSVDEVRMYRDIVSGIKKYIKKAGGLHKAKFGKISGTVREISADAIRFQNSRKKGRHYLARFVKYVADPRVFLNHLGKWDTNSFWSNAYEELQTSQSNYEKNYLNLVNKFVDFRNENKSFFKSLKSKKISINGVEGSIGQFLSIYKLIQQEHSYDHLINQTGGMRVNDKEFHFTEQSINDLKTKIETEFDLNNKDSVGSKYLALTNQFFKESGTLKRTTDMNLYGFTNVLDTNYFPIAISQAEFNKNLSSLNLGDIVFLGSLDYSWNKNRTGKNGIINVSSIDDIIDLHAKQVCTYNAYAEVINDLNYVYNVKQSSQDGFDTGMSLSKTMYNIYGAKDGKGIVDDFLNRLLMNIQGVVTSSGRDKTLTGKLEILRGNFATAKLGLNLKVMVTQLASIPTAFKYVNIFRPLKSFGRGVPKAPALAQYRALNKDIVKSHTLTEQLSKTGKLFEWTTKGINLCDRLAINWIWRACVDKCGAYNADVNSEAYKKAEELFTKAVRETQPNYSPLDRSEMLRSESEIVKIFTQFTTVANKNFSNLIEAIDRRVSGEHTKENSKMIARTSVALLSTFVTYTALCQLFKWLIDDDEDKETLWDYIASEDFLSSFITDNLFGMIPLFNKLEVDIQKKVDGGDLFSSYDFNLGFLDTLNDAKDSLIDMLNGNLLTKKNLFKVFEGAGIPMTNFNKYFVNMPANHLAKCVNVTEVKTWLDTYYNNKSYNQSDIAKTSNEGLAKSKFDTYVNDKLELSTQSNKLLYKVFKTNSNNIDITKVPSTLTDVYGSTITTDTNKFKTSYSKVSNVLNVYNNSSQFNRLDETKQAWVVNKALSTYYSVAKKEQTGEELTRLEMLTTTRYNIANVLIHLSYITAMKNSTESTKKDKVAQYIKSTRLTLEEQYILSRLAGYKIPEKYLNRIKSYLRMKGLTKAQIEQFLA